VHGFIAEPQVFPRTRVKPTRTRGLLRMVRRASSIDGIGIHLLLIVVASLGSGAVLAIAVVVDGCAAISNTVASRGRHTGWF
jgi:hypothetical protein